MVKKVSLYLVKFSLIIFLTITTQIGGVAFLLAELLHRSIKKKIRYSKPILFLLVYLFLTLLVVPSLASVFGREPIKHSSQIKPASCMTVLLNRNYVKPELNDLLSRTEKRLRSSGISMSYLDANFPFFDGFPLLPHLSHNDGKKIDLSLIYQTKKGGISDQQKSISGYGVFEGPKMSEHDQITVCKKQGYFQYDFQKLITFGKINKHLEFSEAGTKTLLKALLKDKSLAKIFIEPHLKTRLRLNDKKIRYHGCRAVRHDDHIHLELK